MVSAEYLAGFMDGEGHLSLGMIPRPRRSTEYPVRVVVYNSNLGLLEEIQRTWGGTVFDTGQRNPRWKPGRALIWTNAEAAGVLTRVAPCLRVKWKQAAELLRFYRHLRKCKRARDRRGRILSLSEQELRLRETSHRRLKRLNARGSRKGNTPRPTRVPRDRWARAGRNLSLEYLAGFIDAEGALMITKCRGPASWNPQYRARVSLSNTYRAVLEDVKRAHGGILVNQRRAEVGWKDAYQLVWSDGMVERLLSLVGPHLRLKQEQATVMLEFIRHRKITRQGRKGRGFAPLPSEVVAFREALYGRIKRLNAKGPHSVSIGRRSRAIASTHA